MTHPVKFNLEKKTIANKFYRKVVYTDSKMQLVFMSLNVGEFIHREKHKGITQFFRVEKGQIDALVGATKYHLHDGDSLIVPPNTWHSIYQVGNKPAKLYTIYTPPNHLANKKDLRQPLED